VYGFSDYFQLFLENAWLYGGAVLIVLSILVFVHEWGHYIVARMCGVKVDTFSIGFGPELFGYTAKSSGTRWKFSLVPLGGYVKMFGDSDPASSQHFNDFVEEDGSSRALTAQEKSVAFFAKSVPQRAAIVFAGPAINFIFAILVLAGLYMFYGKPVTPPIASAILENSAADLAGFEPHDEVLAINGKRISSFEDIRREVMIALDTPMRFTVDRNGEIVEITATPEKESSRDRFGFSQSRGLLGILGPSDGINLAAVAQIDGQAVADTDDARTILSDRLGEKVMLGLSRGDDTTANYYAQPVRDMNEGLFDAEHMDYNHIVITDEPLEEYIVKFGPLESVGEAVNETVDITVGTLQALGQMFTGTRSATELGGIIRIGAIAGDMAQSGFIALVTFTALLSINLGLINLFPIPLLDGGHLVFYAVEGLKGSPVSEDVQEYAFRFGMVVLVGLMLFANLNDLFHLLL
jgi:regulator of sigma E protease